MKFYTLFISILVAIALTACGNREQEPKKSVGTGTTIEGDSTLYGLACEGCNDSVIVFLSGKGGDPVVYDIIEANKKRRVIGRPKTGDWVCLIVNPEDSLKADLVIDLDQLKGTWVSLEKPTLKKRLNMVSPTELKDEEHRAIDSMLAERMKPVEIGFALKRHYTAQPVGMQYNRNIDERSPIVYPTPKRYTEWHIFNGRLILCEGSFMGQRDSLKQLPTRNDTVDIMLMRRDSLRLRYQDGTEKGFYRK